MAQDWFIELLKGTGRLLLHPVFYYSFIIAAVLGVARVKRERKNFTVRSEDAYFELRQLFPLGLLVGLLISAITIGAGLTIPFAAIVLIAAATLLLSFTARVRLLAPAYTVGAAFFALAFLSGKNIELPLAGDLFSNLDEKIYPSIAILLALLTIGEGFLILKNGKKGTSPKLVKSKRGQTVGVHEVKRLWLVPAFMLIPGNILTMPFEWWPVFTLGDNTYSLLLVPFAIGMHQQIQGMLPREAIQQQGSRVIGLGILAVLIAAAGYWYPIAAIAAVSIAIIGREALTYTQRMQEESRPFYFSKKNHGVMILGILPGSPADKMALEVGELVTKVNGTNVNDEKTFYEALSRNRAHCKLEVLDTNAQIRFVQRALYEGDHHELGILFVQDEKKWDSEVG
ncbi:MULTISPECIES: PDZ domain-containing protein [unclassified Mesobacillus]|uniref:PDZ domain-containing protein n=1 Tax=unclassified Mesobacillus TaxID=2675270 RepID=UPI0020413718|nr:PDZ domain-containing protein [Mesobacillus sp. MER 33]MCM3233955.1 PDZ domain-containing protein [Mesobacillus sp. MER 48]